MKDKPARTYIGIALMMALVCTAIGLSTYLYAVRLPFFWDDIFQFAWLQQVSILEVLTTRVAEWSTFRPLSFFTWKLLYDLRGAYDPFLLHLLNVILHIFNGSLLSLIVARQSDGFSALRGITAGILFLLFPFGFQAVVPVNSLMHPLHVCGILLSVLLYQLSMTPGRFTLRALSILLAGVAVLVHENGVLSAGVITLVGLCGTRRKPLRQFLFTLLPYWLCVAVFFLIWRSPPGGGNPFSVSFIFSQMESRLQNTAYFLQAFASPFSAMATPLRDLLASANDLIAIALVSVPVLVVWAVLAWKAKQSRLALLGAAWFALAAMPAILMLPFSYVLESPRLLYLASAGAAIFWAAPLSGQWSSQKIQRVMSAVVAGVLVVSVVWGATFIRRRMELYIQLGNAINQLHNAPTPPACLAQSDIPTLLVNYPAWFFVPETEYLIGHDGITTLSEGQTLDELYRINFNETGSFTLATLPDIMPAGASFVGLGDARTADDLQALSRSAGTVMANLPSREGMTMRTVGCRMLTADTPNAALAVFDQQIALIQGSVAADPQRKELVVTLEWQAQTALAQDVTVFAQALDAAGQLIAQADGYPLGGASPMRLWQAGERWLDVRYIALPDEAALNNARVVVGVYFPQSGQRMSAMDAAGQRVPDDAVGITR